MPMPSRYRVLEPLREFGRAELRDSERVAVAERHSAWYLDLAERSARSLGGPDEAEAATRLDREFGNLRAAFSCFAERGAVEQCARLVVALREYSFRSMRAEVIAWAEEVISDARVRRVAALAAGARRRGVRAVRPWRPRPLHRVRRPGGGGVAAPRRRVVRPRRAVARQLVVLPRRSRGRPAVDRPDARRRPHRLRRPGWPTRSTCDRWPSPASAIRSRGAAVRRRGARRRPSSAVRRRPSPRRLYALGLSLEGQRRGGRRRAPAARRRAGRRRRQSLDPGVRAHGGAVARSPRRVTSYGVGRVRRRHRHVVPRR